MQTETVRALFCRPTNKLSTTQTSVSGCKLPAAHKTCASRLKSRLSAKVCANFRLSGFGSFFQLIWSVKLVAREKVALWNASEGRLLLIWRECVWQTSFFKRSQSLEIRTVRCVNGEPLEKQKECVRHRSTA